MKFQYPVPENSPVSQTFAEHVNRRLRNYNGGLDFAVPIGTPVRAAANGIIKKVGDDPTGYGTHVRIDHGGGYLTLYAHLIDWTVVLEQMVSAGELIGYSGSTGNSTGPHLHFELRQDGKPIDPQPLLTWQADDAPTARFTVRVDNLNVRAGPGVQYPVKRTLSQCNSVEGRRLSGETWVQIGPDEWVAMTYGQDIYLERER